MIKCCPVLGTKKANDKHWAFSFGERMDEHSVPSRRKGDDSPQSTGLFVSLQRPVQKGTGVGAKASGPACLGSASMAHRNRPGQTVVHRKTIFTSPSRLPRPRPPTPTDSHRRRDPHPKTPCPNRGIWWGVLYRVGTYSQQNKNKLVSQTSTSNNIHVFVDDLGPLLPPRIRDAGSGVKHGTRLVRRTV